MDTKLEPIVKALQEKFSTSLEEFREEVHVFVNPADIIAALTLLRDGYQFELLSAMTATDYWPQQTPRFHVIYQLSSLARNTTIQLRVPVDGADPRIPTATGVYETANWRERELKDMFGIIPEGQKMATTNRIMKILEKHNELFELDELPWLYRDAEPPMKKAGAL